mmetsp:Transcript_42451/g.111733  ORF Transcript_42451/g.111733 Transcript_42451/m.111733 type:complete len:89 (-) Transcript_42451:266-532(-)
MVSLACLAHSGEQLLTSLHQLLPIVIRVGQGLRSAPTDRLSFQSPLKRSLSAVAVNVTAIDAACSLVHRAGGQVESIVSTISSATVAQ